MDPKFGGYPRFYARKKSLLFPIIEKYAGISLAGKTHGEAIQVYINLLRTNPAFKTEVDNAISGSFSGATGIDPVSAVAGAVGSVFGFLQAGKANDAEFTQAVLQEQNAKNTQTLLIVGGITLASLSLIGLGIYLAVKKKR